MQLVQEGLELFQYEDVGDIQVVYPIEALNHCPIKRSRLKEELQTRDLLSKTFIPEDGETIVLE